jgi:hypothetical protein
MFQLPGRHRITAIKFYRVGIDMGRKRPALALEQAANRIILIAHIGQEQKGENNRRPQQQAFAKTR